MPVHPDKLEVKVDNLNNPMFNLDVDKGKVRGTTMALLIAVPAVIVVCLLYLLISYRSNVESAVANLASLLPVGYAFAAGMVASVNPCGVMMLPTYILYHVGTSETEQEDKKRSLNRIIKGLMTSLVVTAGFVFIFSAVGGIITLGGQWLVNVFPYAGLLIGVAMLGVGVWMLVSHQSFGFAAVGRLQISPKRNLGNMFTFGVIYAIGSLSCTLPIFLVVVGSALATENSALSIGQFLGYAMGMGSVILVVTQAAVIFKVAVTRWLERFSSLMHRFNALFLLGAGGYLVVYWVFIAELR
jgi:cytochrome c biogenesis protein CcdA